MKSILFAVALLLGSSAFACPNIDGIYQLNDPLKIRLKISNSSCQQALIEALDTNNSPFAQRTDVYDGNCGNQNG